MRLTCLRVALCEHVLCSSWILQFAGEEWVFWSQCLWLYLRWLCQSEPGDLQAVMSAEGCCYQRFFHWWRRISEIIRRQHCFCGPALLIHVPLRVVVTSGMCQQDHGGDGVHSFSKHRLVQKSYYIRQHTLPKMMFLPSSERGCKWVADPLQAFPKGAAQAVLSMSCIGRMGWLLYCQ